MESILGSPKTTMQPNAIDHTRLGPHMRNRRDYSVHQRESGMDAGGRLIEGQKYTVSTILLVLGIIWSEDYTELLSCEAIGSILFTFGIVLLCDAAGMRIPHLMSSVPLPVVDISFNAYEGQDALFHDMYGYGIEKARQMFLAMHFPPHLTLNQGRHAFKFDGEHAFLYMLFRYRSPSQRQTLDERTFGYDYSVLSKVFKAACVWIDNTHGHRLRDLQAASAQFPYFNECIRTKIATQFPGIPMPADAEHCALFVDGTRIRVSRPAGPYWKQYAWFSGDKWFHCLGAQGVLAPNGLFVDWFDGPVGRQNDKYFWRDSGVNGILRDLQIGNLIQYWAYGDKGYNNSSHLRAAAHLPGPPLTVLQIFENWLMAKERISVEWGYAKVKARCPLLNCPHLLKLQASDVSCIVRVAVLLSNAHTCMHQSETGLYYNCPAPSVEEYFA